MTLGRPLGYLAFSLVSSLAAASCAGLSPPRLDANQFLQQRSLPLTIAGGTVEIHLANRVPPRANAPLVVFASGDGGWFGAAVGMFETVAHAGYPVVGLSSRGLLRHLRTPGHPLTATHVLAAYAEIITAARQALNLPPGRAVVLAGWSRGASISVIVGAERAVPAITGIVAIGLAADENLNVDLASDDDAEVTSASTLHGLDIYALSRSIPGHVAVIQSSGDGYLPAARARTLFGANTGTRHFYEVPATNHRFTGGETSFRQNLLEALDWTSVTEESHQ